MLCIALFVGQQHTNSYANSNQQFTGTFCDAFLFSPLFINEAEKLGVLLRFDNTEAEVIC